MMKFLLSTTFLATVVAAQLHHSTASDDCVVHASVRAEDLAPTQISHGELRIKVKQAHCVNQIASVALRLQLDEFGEVKHLRPGAVIPSIQKSHNQHTPDDFLGYSGGISNETVYDYGPYDEAMSDSALWLVKAEERMAWSTEVVLFENNPDFSEPMVTPFIVACPAVNYPPSVEGYRRDVVGSRAVRRHGYAQLGYHYTAIVNFTDGRTVDLPAGYTTFVPTSPAPPPKTAFTWNATFTENKPGCEELPSEWLDNVKKCLPEELRSLFTAEVTLEEGNIIQRGELLKGTVTIHSTNGSTTMSDINIGFATSNSYHWATEQAERGGDLHYRKFVCQGSETRGLSIHSFPWVFQKDGGDSFSHHRLAADNTHFDFEFQIQQGAAPDFQSYFSSGSASLELRLGVLYSEDVSTCIDGDKYSRATLDAQRVKMATEQAAHDEEQLWNSYSPVPERVEALEPVEPPIQYIRRLDLTATVPLVVLGEISTQPMEHYLKPSLPSPIILVPETAGEFSVAHPEIVEEPFETTSARLMRSGGTYAPRDRFKGGVAWSSFPRDTPDPAKRYRALGEEADCDGEGAPGGRAS
ncbi:hypothetical protein DFH09DRAFT_1208862 [Mycena vulgaris]|nr:hypothetical protein DFH09DRAFT_1208862 [Mycena vulgaris]